MAGLFVMIMNICQLIFEGLFFIDSRNVASRWLFSLKREVGQCFEKEKRRRLMVDSLAFLFIVKCGVFNFTVLLSPIYCL